MIDERLREYAGRWQVAQPPPLRPVLPQRRPARGWVAATAVAAAVVTILAAGTVLTGERRQVPAAGSVVVPWAAHPSDRGVSTTLPERDCRPEDLDLAAQLIQYGSPRHLAGNVFVRKPRAGICTVRDLRLELRGGDGSALAVESTRSAPERPVPIDEGELILVPIEWRAPYCGPVPRSLELLVGLGAAEPVRVELHMTEWDGRGPGCDPADAHRGSFAHGAPFMQDKILPTVRLDGVPPALSSDGVLRYRLVLENRSSRRLSLTPCPVFEHGLRPPVANQFPHSPRSGRLNCEQAPPYVEPGRSVVFEMEFWVGRFAWGDYELYVDVEPSFRQDRVELVAPVTVLVGGAGQQVRACGLGDLEFVPPNGYGGEELHLTGGSTAGHVCAVPEPRVAIITADGRRVQAVGLGAWPSTIHPGQSVKATVRWGGNCDRRSLPAKLELTDRRSSERIVLNLGALLDPPCRETPTPASATWS